MKIKIWREKPGLLAVSFFPGYGITVRYSRYFPFGESVTYSDDLYPSKEPDGTPGHDLKDLTVMEVLAMYEKIQSARPVGTLNKVSLAAVKEMLEGYLAEG